MDRSKGFERLVFGVWLLDREVLVSQNISPCEQASKRSTPVF
jgi:hypothetical protein